MLRRFTWVALLAAGCSQTITPAAPPDASPDVAPDASPDDASKPADVAPDEASKPADVGPEVDPCGEGLTRCGETCVDTATDGAHCGACGAPCAEGERCEAGACASVCPPGQTDCGGLCRDLSTDRVSCGACGNLCPSGQSCVEGACVVVCAATRTNCGGRCVDLQSADDNCGACERRCAAGTRCMAGACRGDPCGPADTAAGRCDGNAVVRCVDGVIAREACDFGEVCAGTPAACAPPTGPRRVSGRVTYQLRPAGPSGVGSLRYEPLAGAPVELVDAAGRVVVQGLTGDDGAYGLGHAEPEGSMLRVRVTLSRGDAHYNFVVRDYASATFAFTTMPFAAGAADARDVAIPVEGNSGAAAIFASVRRAFDFLRPYVTGRPAALYVTWQRGRATGTNQSSYFTGTSSTMFINGSDTDPDEFDPPVISHEFGHYIQRWYSRSSNPGGAHDGRPADPNLAFGEGGASFLGSLITGSRYYIDAGVSRLRLLQDLQAVPLFRTYVADASLPMSQPISEWLVAGAQYAMFRASTDVEQQTGRAMRVLTGYLRRSPYPDRGEPGVDLVEYLDGYLCVNDGAERAIIMSYLVSQRRFPYDFGYPAVCR
ncbi:MAG: MXAN_6577-like cysteine-rich protein [Polyangiales bacterium]